ncbi:MAG: DUF58 domain-containing protein [Vulcanisaeta sp.]|uniref:DUF58 domain-containing protein n=1 Tax=Vulcanisaeta sp. TaxID=2020871 RepID=UPI003D0DA137
MILLIALIIIFLMAFFIFIGYLRPPIIVMLLISVIYTLITALALVVFYLINPLYILPIILSLLQYVIIPPLGILLGWSIRTFASSIKLGLRYVMSNMYLIRKLLPITYAIYLTFSSIINPLVLMFSMLALSIEWYFYNKDKFGLVLTIFNVLIVLMLPFSAAVVFSVILTVILDSELMGYRYNPWIITASFAASSAFAYILIGFYEAVVLFIPLVYFVLSALAYWLLYLMIDLKIDIKGFLRTIVDNELNYDMIITSKPKVSAIINIDAPRDFKVEPKSSDFRGHAKIKVNATFESSGVYRPRFLIRFVDPRGFINVIREISHPSILVVPRTTYLVGTYQRILSGFAGKRLGDVVGIKEYTPGDPIKKIHWAKSIKFDKYVIKLSSNLTSTVIVIANTTNSKILDRLNEALLVVTIQLLNHGVIPKYLVINVLTGKVIRIDWNGNYADLVTKLLSATNSLGVNLIGKSYGTELFAGIRRVYQEDFVKLLSKFHVEVPIILIGEKRFLNDIYNALLRLYGYGGVKSILI